MQFEVLQEILRPKKWEDLVGLEYKPDGVTTEKEILIDLAKSDRAMSILFYGPPGTGKTSAVMLFAKEYLGENIHTKFKRYNASSDVKVETIRTDLVEFAGSEDDTGIRNIVFFDEVDGLKWQQQDALRAVMEDFSYSCIFLMACNKINRMHDAIISRSTIFKMDKLPENWCKKWFLDSCKQCNIEVAADIPKKVIDYYDGDLRHIISDFFTKFYGKKLTTWNPQPTFAKEIFEAENRRQKYLDIAQKTYVEPIQLLHEIFKLNNYKNAKELSLAADRILAGGDVMINMVMALDSI